jgi:hypothetical protein
VTSTITEDTPPTSSPKFDHSPGVGDVLETEQLGPERVAGGALVGELIDWAAVS